MLKERISKERFALALQEFDQYFRDTPEWRNWDQLYLSRTALRANGKIYPLKKTIALATNTTEYSFPGGTWLHKQTKHLELDTFELETIKPLAPPQFVVNGIYDRQTEINGPFGGSQQGGISASKAHPVIFIFTGESGEQYGYRDGWKDEAYLYTGEGRVGDMKLDRGNKAIAEHSKSGKTLHLFKSLGKSQGYSYIGEFTCADMFTRAQPDVEKNERKAIIFRLIPIEKIEYFETHLAETFHSPDTLEEARAAALAACILGNEEQEKSAIRKIYQRSKKVAKYVLLRANGKCESCRKPAPFMKKDGTPYLEPHHVNRVSDGGLDNPLYVAAICPNCHREIHSGADGDLLNASLKLHIAKIEKQKQSPMVPLTKLTSGIQKPT